MTERSHNLGPVLVPVDFSSQSEQAFLFAADYARNCGASLVVLHVMHDAAKSPGAYRMEDGIGGLLPMKEAARVLLDQFHQRLVRDFPQDSADLPLEFRLASGIPATRILEIAERIQARLIVIGNTGQGSFSRLLTGSTASKVIKETLIPVTLVKAPTDRGT